MTFYFCRLNELVKLSMFWLLLQVGRRAHFPNPRTPFVMFIKTFAEKRTFLKKKKEKCVFYYETCSFCI